MDLLAMFLLFALPLLLLHLLSSFKHSSKNNLPPGPISWPLVGTIVMSLTEKRIHVVLTDLAQTYGPLMYLKFGVEPLIVASTREAAMEILKTRDRLLSGRYVPHSVQVKGYIEESMVWSDCNEYWKLVRKIWRTEMFSTKMLEAQKSMREEKVREMMEFLRRREGQVVNITDVIFGCIINILGSFLFNQNVYDFEGKIIDNDKGMKGIIRQLMILAATPNLPDFYPIFDRFDLQGLRRSTTECVKRMNESWAAIVKERRRARTSKDHSYQNNDFLDVLIEANFTDPQIDALFLEIFGPGSDTSTCSIEWAMSELIRNPDELLKVQDELKRVIGNREVTESDLPNLPYLHACVKETLRLHPPVTFLVPHRAIETCQVMNYTIPAESQLLVNAYAIGRDPKTWDDPSSFKPERFVNSEVDYQGNDFHYIPFGAGRRICPAISMATRVTRLILASLIHNFNWSLPNGMKPSELDMQEMFGLVLFKEVPLCITPTPRVQAKSSSYL